MRGMPNSLHLRPSRGHNAGFLTFEAVITYPFHPLAGQTVLVVGDYEHSGIHHLLIRQPQGGFIKFPIGCSPRRQAPSQLSSFHDFPSDSWSCCVAWWIVS